ncbi:MAG: HAD family hydrolase [Candidatus Riflebacteria bacterium]|nr:HAD family hydrolase [Candidatus Riflebacteria bacterium]
MIQAVVFDLYGTLVDVQTNEQALPAYERLAEWLSDRKIRANPATLAKSFSDGVDKLKSALAEPDTEIDVAQVFSLMLQELGVAKPGPSLVADLAWSFRKFTRTRCQPLPGANDLIQRLRMDYKLGIVANAQKLFTMKELEELRLVEAFEAITLSSNTGFRKPSSKIFEVCLQDLEVSPEEAIFVGDSIEEDIVGAKSVGMKTLLISSTAQTGPVEPDGRIKRINEVSRFLEEWQEPLETPLVDEIIDQEE